jgi:hypothetical protein
MMDEQCLDYVKPFYYPDEAAAAWCGITEEKYLVLKKKACTDDFNNMPQNPMLPSEIDITEPKPTIRTFDESFGYGTFALLPEKPCFKKRIEQICYAIEVGEITHQRDGRLVENNDHVARPRRTLKAKDLKKWIEENHPNERPAFLFDQLERKEFADREQLYAQNIELQNKNDNLKHRLDRATQVYHEQKSDGKETKQQKRERAFKFWLAGKNYPPHPQAQSKKHINDGMTRADVWSALQAIDLNLFNANQKEFFDKQQLAIFLDYV